MVLCYHIFILYAYSKPSELSLPIWLDIQTSHTHWKSQCEYIVTDSCHNDRPQLLVPPLPSCDVDEWFCYRLCVLLFDFIPFGFVLFYNCFVFEWQHLIEKHSKSWDVDAAYTGWLADLDHIVHANSLTFGEIRFPAESGMTGLMPLSSLHVESEATTSSQLAWLGIRAGNWGEAASLALFVGDKICKPTPLNLMLIMLTYCLFFLCTRTEVFKW